jgi:hypothetical protein
VFVFRGDLLLRLDNCFWRSWRSDVTDSVRLERFRGHTGVAFDLLVGRNLTRLQFVAMVICWSWWFPFYLLADGQTSLFPIDGIPFR